MNQLKHKFKLLVDKHSIKGIIENPKASKIIILAHGFTGDMQGPDMIFEKLSSKLQKENYAVLRFAFRGTPPSEGKFEDMTVQSETEDLRQIIKYVNALGYAQIGILGESMGGTIAVTAFDKSINIVIFWYPAFDFSETDFNQLFFSDSTKNEFEKYGYVLCDGYKVGKQFIQQCLSINVYDQLKKIDCPVLLLHGDQDKEVPFHQSEIGYQLLSNPKEICIINGADHCFMNEHQQVINLTVQFIKKYL